MTDKPVWVTEVGVVLIRGRKRCRSWGVKRTAELLIGRAAPHPLVLASTTCRNGLGGGRPGISEAEGSILLPPFRHGAAAGGTARRSWRWMPMPLSPAEMGLMPMVSLPRPSARGRRRHGSEAAWREAFANWDLSWADSFRPDALAWFDRQMDALEPSSTRDRHLLLHARASRRRAAPHQPGARPAGLRRLLRLGDRALRAGASGGGRDGGVVIHLRHPRAGGDPDAPDGAKAAAVTSLDPRLRGSDEQHQERRS